MPAKNIVVLVAGLLIIALTAGGVGYYQENQRLSSPGIRCRTIHGQVAVEVLLPEILPGYESVPLEVTQEELDMLPKDTSFGRRRYTAPDGLVFDLSVVLMGGDISSIHRPQSCIPAQGWTILDEDTDTLRIDGDNGYELPFNRLKNAKTVVINEQPVKAEGYFLFWFTADGKVTASRESRLLSTAWRMLTSGEVERWGYVSLNVVFPAGAADMVYPRAEEFLKTAVPQFQLPPTDRPPRP
ncbi:MAG TPA: hypothetical protein DCY13_00785 [Verrucomicrobiales bacterium]|nr:hypothetical protein [Verrucomicrobiales bacterium]